MSVQGKLAYWFRGKSYETNEIEAIIGARMSTSETPGLWRLVEVRERDKGIGTRHDIISPHQRTNVRTLRLEGLLFPEPRELAQRSR